MISVEVVIVVVAIVVVRGSSVRLLGMALTVIGLVYVASHV